MAVVTQISPLELGEELDGVVLRDERVHPSRDEAPMEGAPLATRAPHDHPQQARGAQPVAQGAPSPGGSKRRLSIRMPAYGGLPGTPVRGSPPCRFVIARSFPGTAAPGLSWRRVQALKRHSGVPRAHLAWDPNSCCQLRGPGLPASHCHLLGRARVIGAGRAYPAPCRARGRTQASGPCSEGARGRRRESHPAHRNARPPTQSRRRVRTNTSTRIGRSSPLRPR